MINRNTLQSEAGKAAFGRGEEYFESGRVGSLRHFTNGVQAMVSGQQRYQVRLAWNGGFDYSCNCPMGREGDCCKHCVAVGLAWLGRDKMPESAMESEESAIRNWLERRKKQELVSIIMDASESDDRLFKRLLLKASASTLDLNALKQSISVSIDVDDLDYSEMRDHVEALGNVTDMLESLLEDGYAQEVRALALHAIDCMEEAYNHIGVDADYEMQCWQRIHLRACEAAPPATDAAREELAAELFEREAGSEWETFYGRIEQYAGLLGEAGMAEYRGLVQQAWEKLPVLKPGAEKSYQDNRFRISSMMESLARLSGDVDALLAVKARDLSGTYRFLQIAEILKQAGRIDEAVSWAEKGVAAFAKQPDSRLEASLAELYAQQKHFDKAMAFAWKPFERQPSLHHWQLLKDISTQAESWDGEWRQRALDEIRRQIATEKNSGGYCWRKPDATYARQQSVNRILSPAIRVSASVCQSQPVDVSAVK